MKLANKVAIVTGAARGIGAGIAQVLAREGACVVLADRDSQGEHTAARINQQFSKQLADAPDKSEVKAIFICCDITQQQQVQALFQQAITHFGEIDILVNNAGINRDAMLHKMSTEDWDKVIAVNLKGTFLCLQQAAMRMRERGCGRIINISSASWLGNIGQANYAASKAGVIGLTKTACRELAKKGITVNAICPGFIDTEMTRGVPEKVWQMMVNKIPAGYVGEVTDIGEGVAFLASDAARYINGEVINIGGGMVL